MAAARNYHSTAVLMPDGRVLVAGGGHYNAAVGPGQFSAQFYSPPYLFNGARPTITSAPAAAHLRRAHHRDHAGRRARSARSTSSRSARTRTRSTWTSTSCRCSFTAGSGSLTVQAPASAALAPPGDYMLFIVNDKGVPSVASHGRIPAARGARRRRPASTAAAGNGSGDRVLDRADDGGRRSPYTVTPYVGATAQTPIVGHREPAGHERDDHGLTNGTAYTFTVTRDERGRHRRQSSPSERGDPPPGAGTPAFVQQASDAAGTPAVGAAADAAVDGRQPARREVGVWSSGNATASAVTDSAGDTYTELTTSRRPTIPSRACGPRRSPPAPARSPPSRSPRRPTPTSARRARVLGPVGGGRPRRRRPVEDGTGTTGAARRGVVRRHRGEHRGGRAGARLLRRLRVRELADRRPGYSVRTNVSPTGDMEFLAQDQVLGAAGATANPVTHTGGSTPWLAATLVLKSAAPPAGGASAASVASTVSTSAAKRVYAFALPRPARPLAAGVALLCPLASWAQRLTPQAFTLHLVRPHRRTSRHRLRHHLKHSARSSGAAKRRGHRR